MTTTISLRRRDGDLCGDHTDPSQVTIPDGRRSYLLTRHGVHLRALDGLQATDTRRVFEDNLSYPPRGSRCRAIMDKLRGFAIRHPDGIWEVTETA